jgi:hypothetical protein
MSDDFGTVTVKKGDRAREIEVLRQHYNVHRETLTQMVPDAPTEHLAAEYKRIIADIDASIRKLDELDRVPSTTAAGLNETQRMGTSPGNRPLVTPIAEPVTDHGIASYDPPADRPSGNSSRVLLMLVIALAVLGVIGWLIWRASSDRKPTGPQVIEQPATTTSTVAETAAPGTVVPTAVEVSSIRITPEVADYGVIRKGTRAVRQFEITNTTSTPLSFVVARSACRCLYYEYNAKTKLAPKAKEALTVTVDGARAKAGALEEQIAVTSKDDPNAKGTIGVRAVIK